MGEWLFTDCFTTTSRRMIKTAYLKAPVAEIDSPSVRERQRSTKRTCRKLSDQGRSLLALG